MALLETTFYLRFQNVLGDMTLLETTKLNIPFKKNMEFH
jgi:hypothetical protein